MKNKKKNICLGIVAHVDAGKTTMSEAMLCKCGVIRTPGRVDHKDTYLDTHSLEKERGITIFSKQAVFDIKDKRFYLLDTPGHMDFSAEMERTLSVLDYAVLVVSGPDGVQAHTETLWRLLRRHHIPTFVWINKMDRCERSPGEIIADLEEHFGSGFFNAAALTESFEEIAMSEEKALNEFLETGCLSDDTLRILIKRRAIFPCWFGAALKMDGVDDFLEGLAHYTVEPERKDSFGAKVFKLTYDEKGNRMSWMKLTGGSLKVRGMIGEEKVTQLRIYNGKKFDAVDEVFAGDVAAVLGLEKSFAGQGLGAEEDAALPVLEPVLSYRIIPPSGVDNNFVLQKLAPLAEEDPMLRIVWNSELKEIQIQLMGQVQIEVLKKIIEERFDLNVEISTGKILYKETIAAPVEGMGHFEPLRHYAEVHLLLEPLPAGSGIIFESACSTDDLALNWQRLILTNLAEKTHKGVLTGSPVTDIKITVIAGRAHLKHTEGGDFRQATYRAVRQGLMKAQNVLLEPYYNFVLEVPSEYIGRAMSDLKAMYAKMDSPRTLEKTTVITGAGPVSSMEGYLNDVLAYTRGLGHISCNFGGYYPCHNTEEVIEARGYDPERDTWNSADSVFCSHGAGVNVKWDLVEDFMHLDSGLSFEDPEVPKMGRSRLRTSNINFDDKELEAIMEKEFGPIKRPKYSTVTYDSEAAKKRLEDKKLKKDYLIIDGYNLLFAAKSDKPDQAENQGSSSNNDLQGSVIHLIETLQNYAAFKGLEAVLVFDGYKVKDNPGTKESESGLKVVFTKEGESADFYIEKLVKEIGRNYNVKVVSSDGMIQLAALQRGCIRVSSKELISDIKKAKDEINAFLERKRETDGFTNRIRNTK